MFNCLFCGRNMCLLVPIGKQHSGLVERRGCALRCAGPCGEQCLSCSSYSLIVG